MITTCSEVGKHCFLVHRPTYRIPESCHQLCSSVIPDSTKTEGLSVILLLAVFESSDCSRDFHVEMLSFFFGQSDKSKKR